ncbi:hypothetical protein TrST_g3640 [Triparma strigata]|uniref:Uncharacterized protein n=1 Tax=Triparma strigata TaxID=1606541 RepID=A0A9W7A6J2_9STRA|nr:hypothetical protein TrST_g3640 [Triparma strigata]
MPFPRPPASAQPRKITLAVSSEMLAHFSFPYSPTNKPVEGSGGRREEGDGNSGQECVLFSGSNRWGGNSGRSSRSGVKKRDENGDEDDVDDDDFSLASACSGHTKGSKGKSKSKSKSRGKESKKKSSRGGDDEGYSVKLLYSTLVSLLSSNREKLKNIFNTLSYSRKCSLIDLNLSIISDYEKQGDKELGGGGRDGMEGLIEGFKLLGVLIGCLRLGRMKGDEKVMKRARKGLEALRESSYSSAFRGEIVKLMFDSRLMLQRRSERDVEAERKKVFEERFSSGSLYIADELKSGKGEGDEEEVRGLSYWLGVESKTSSSGEGQLVCVEDDWRRFPEFREDYYFRR